jgi:inhibitor of cysteine peptidase
MKKSVMVIAIALLVAAASGFNWIWQSFDNSGEYAFEFSGNNSVKIVNPAGQIDGGEIPGILEVPLNSQFTLTLDANPSTGYQWQLSESLDEDVLKLEGKEYSSPATDVLGAGGKETWTFSAVGQGTAGISLEYARPWEEDVPPAVNKSFTVIVSGESAEPEPAPGPTADITTVVGATLNFSISQPVVPGGEWSLVGPLDESILKLVGDEVITPEGLVGASLRVFTFKAVGAGLTTVYFENDFNRTSFTAYIIER